MPEFHSSNPLVTGIDPAVLDAQRQANAALRAFPHPDPRTPEGLQMLRTLTANNVAGTKLSPADRIITTSRGDIRLHVFVPDGPVRGVMLDLHGGGWAAGAPEDDHAFSNMATPLADLAVARTTSWITSILDQAPHSVGAEQPRSGPGHSGESR